MTVSPSPAIPFCGSSLRESRHVCAFFHSLDDEYHTMAPFIQDGFAHGERGVNFVARDRPDHLDRLRRAGVDVDDAQRNGQLEMLSSAETYLRDGRFDQDAMLASLQRLLDEGHERGFPLTRLIAHVEHVMGDWEGACDFLEYEARLNYMLARYPDPVICTYDLNQISASVAMDVLRTHPVAIIDAVLHENPFYVPPDTLLGELRERRARDERARPRGVS